MAEPAEEAYRENAREEGDVEPRDRAAPIDVAEIAEDRNKLQDCEGDVASRQGPDPEEIVLAARMKRREADSDEPRSDGPGGQRREYPRPSPLDGVRGEEESDANREHADTLTEDQKPHPCRTRGTVSWRPARKTRALAAYRSHRIGTINALTPGGTSDVVMPGPRCGERSGP